MGLLTEIKIWGYFLMGLRGFLRHPISLEQAKSDVKKRLEERETNFLNLMERGVFGNPRTPYLSLMKLARCEMGDIRIMVKEKGLEETLIALREAGVYVTFEEFKGREPIVRDGRVIPAQAKDFDNPYLQHYYPAESGGSTGTPTRILVDLDHLATQVSIMLGREAHDVLEAPTAIWFDIIPDTAGINSILRHAHFGRVPQKWFTPNTNRNMKPATAFKLRLGIHSMIAVGRLFGSPMPWPETVVLDDAVEIARWAATAIKRHGACLVKSHVSKALRVCVAARKAGIDLTGATFLVGGEPPTRAKVRGITHTGAHCLPFYPFSEHGTAGIGCANPIDENDIHFCKDSLALIQFARQVPGSSITVDAFNFTSLLPTAPKLLLNTESDDYGLVEKRSCGCPLEKCGFTEHLRHIRSFRKLTSEGGTLIGSDMVRILEEVLPAQYGGSPLDYQLIEEEDEDGFTRLCLIVSPKIQIADEKAVVETVLNSLRQSNLTPGEGRYAAEMTRSLWNHANTLRVKRMEPIWTGHGKLLPLHLGRRFKE